MARRILVVEDDESIRATFQQLLEMEGYVVQLASNGKLALDLLRSSPELPSLILLDIMMPVMNGLEFRKEQELDPRLAKIPVVVMTANAHLEAMKLELGANGYLRKPSDIDSVLDLVASLSAENPDHSQSHGALAAPKRGRPQ